MSAGLVGAFFHLCILPLGQVEELKRLFASYSSKLLGSRSEVLGVSIPSRPLEMQVSTEDEAVLVSAHAYVAAA